MDYEVQPGDCITSIAAENGFLPETIWNHANNSALKQKRKNPNVLSPGDVVFIPDKEIKEVSATTEHRHNFKLKATPAKLRIRLLRNDRPRSNKPYALIVDGRRREGTTDGQGWIVQPIPPNAREGTLLLPDTEEEYLLQLGHLDPVDEPSGARARLSNLGFTPDSGDNDGDGLTGAVAAFQKSQKLTVTGNLDQATKDALKTVHGS